MGNPTEELRAKLDELGVEWWPSDDPCCEDVITHWCVGPFQWTAIEGEKDLWLNAGIAGHEPLTPEQAIAATVGVDSDTGEAIRKLLDKLNTELCNAGCIIDCETREERQRLIDAVKDKYAQAIAATVGAGTCHMEVKDNLDETEGMGDVWLECDKCHWQMMLEPTTPRFKYCPNCGRRIEEESE